MKVGGSGQAQSLAIQQIKSDHMDQKSGEKNVDSDLKGTEKFNFNKGKAKAKGVQKKFEDPDSQFNGVADLRLRINFAEQLQGLDISPVSEPKGEGSAYSRFLEIYEGIETGSQDSDEIMNDDESGDIQTEV